MKIQHVYTVTRTFEIDDDELEGSIDFFKGAITDETGEYLYGGTSYDETIDVYMRVFRNGKWKVEKTR